MSDSSQKKKKTKKLEVRKTVLTEVSEEELEKVVGGGAVPMPTTTAPCSFLCH